MLTAALNVEPNTVTVHTVVIMAASVTQQMWDDMISHAGQFGSTLPDRDGHFRAMKDEIKTIDNVEPCRQGEHDAQGKK